MHETRFQRDTLQAARHARGFTLAEVSERSGISSALLSRIESGLRVPSEEEAKSLAQALGCPRSMLDEQLPVPSLGLPAFYHRKFSRAGVKDVRRFESACRLASLTLRRLFAVIDHTSERRWPDLEGAACERDPERAAAMVRLAWQLPTGPLENLTAAIERAGGVVISTDFQIEAMDALYQVVPGLPPLFWLNDRRPADRARFSLAHELGHAVLHENPTDPQLAEREADQFAAALLMPRADFKRECPSALSLPTLAQMKRRWRVSIAAIVRRARDVGRISQTQYEGWVKELSRQGWRKNEPIDLERERPSLLPTLIERAITQGELSEEELEDTLSTTIETIRAWQAMGPADRPRENGPGLRLAR